MRYRIAGGMPIHIQLQRHCCRCGLQVTVVSAAVVGAETAVLLPSKDAGARACWPLVAVAYQDWRG